LTDNSVFSNRTLIVAFEGWNDAGEAASAAARFLINSVGGSEISSVDSQQFYDFQFARPMAVLDENGNRTFRWPNASIYRPELTTLFDFRVLLGVEPSRNWIQFSKEIVDAAEAEEIDAVIFLGAMLADAPHSRPISVTATSTNDFVCEAVPAEKSLYEGPVGILSILSAEFEARQIPTMSLWASVPHYVHNGQVPKATLALVSAVEGHLGLQFDHKELPNEAFRWERSVDELAEADEELAEYVATLEKTRDELEGTNGDTLAREVEQFLRESDEDR
jgi:predicted ATP-grasp superfamily ATP-dependent carboligase